jgi:hypothetical protein
LPAITQITRFIHGLKTFWSWRLTIAKLESCDYNGQFIVMSLESQSHGPNSMPIFDFLAKFELNCRTPDLTPSSLPWDLLLESLIFQSIFKIYSNR